MPPPLAGEVVHLAHKIAVEVIEAPILRPELLIGMAEMPLSGDERSIARILQSLRQGAFVRWQAVGVAREDHKSLQPVAHGVAAGHECRARGRANRLAVEGLQAHAFVGEPVDIRCLDLAAPVAEIGVAQIVGHNEHDVGLLAGRECSRGGREVENRREAQAKRLHGLSPSLFQTLSGRLC